MVWVNIAKAMSTATVSPVQSFKKLNVSTANLMPRLALPINLCSSPELPFDLILLGTGQSGHLGEVRFGRHAVSKHSLA